VLSREEIISMQESIKSVRFDRAVAEYVVRLVETTRGDARLRLGLSPRGSLALYRTAQVRARMEGRDHVEPEDVRALAVPVLAHRLMLDTKAKYAGLRNDTLIEEALEKVPVPR
jgi:MoxR-like ATPase